MRDFEEPHSFIEAALAVAGLIRRLEEGEEVDLEAFLRQHPDLSPELVDELRLRARAGELLGAGSRNSGSVAPPIERATPLASDEEPALRELIARLPRVEPGRYADGGPIGEGGIGIVDEVHDPTLGRTLARKRLQEDRVGRVDGFLGSDQLRWLWRFVDEARITAQLDHPGVVPVHELAVGPDGRLYFTMKKVRGESLQTVYRRVRAGEGGWSVTRAVGVLQRVCETVAFAHEHGVLHRDLKPANVMVGRFGEAYVMDWGLASNRGLDPGGSKSRVDTLVSDSGSGTRTREGAVVGTLFYLAPEQARGAHAEVGPHSDAYAIGAMLYELLTGRPPHYCSPEARDFQAVLGRIERESPAPVPAECGAPELIAICERALRRDPAERFGSVKELADELRAYLENRVVKSYRTGAVTELRKWVARNRATAAALAALVVVLLGGAALVAWKEQQRADEATKRRVLAQETADFELARRLVRADDELGPIHPDHAPGYERWLDEVADLEQRRDAYVRELEALRRSGQRLEPPDDPEHPLVLEIRRLEYHVESSEEVLRRARTGDAEPDRVRRAREGLATLEPEQDRRRARLEELRHKLELERPWLLDSPAAQERHDELARHVRRLDALLHERFGLRNRVRADLARARSLALETVDRHAGEWEEAIRSIARPGSPYGGLEIPPQVGLVPLGENTRTGLWEFWHVLSGDRPLRDASGELVPTAESGIVLVLVPGGRVLVGAQADDSGAPRFDPSAAGHERGLHAVQLDPYFLARHELTQGQWRRAGAANPSEYRIGDEYTDAGVISALHPVEHVSWTEANRVLGRWSLTLPTESQWEHGARGGTDTVYWTGDDAASLAGAANLLGAEWCNGEKDCSHAHEQDVTDGYRVHAPVGSLEANPYGLHDVHGNVAEWCLDWTANNYRVLDVVLGTGEHRTREARRRSLRGGSFLDRARDVRCAHRDKRGPEHQEREIGIRPCRPVQTTPYSSGEKR